MQDFVLSLQAAQQESVPPNEITNLLVLFQTDINAKFFVKSKDNKIEEVFKEIWKFFLFAANHSSSSVRLSSYRATGAFLLKLSPYYTYIVQKSFSDISMIATIDIKSSAIIASSFAFISSRISLPYLDEFLNDTPVFHHFAISDPIFSQNLSPIISNLGELGFEWFSTLLHSFLNLSNSCHDRHLMKSITSVIIHDPINLMNDYLQYNKDQNSYQKDLQLSSYILTTGHVYHDSFDLYEIAKAALDVLKHPNDFNSTEIDSAFQILSIKSPSFYLQVDSAGQESVSLTLSKKKPDNSMDLIDFGFNDNSNNQESYEQISIVIKVSTFLIRPTIFLLDLPVMFSEPQPTDGSLTLAAKFKSLANRINIYPEKTSVVLSTFLKYYNKKYDNVVSAVLQGIAECVPTLIKYTDITVLAPLLESAIFTEQTSWFHLSDILSIVEKIPLYSFEKLFGSNGLERIAVLLIHSCMSQNDKICARSSEILRKTVTSQNFYQLTLLLIESIDIFDDDNLSHLLPVISDIISDHKNENMKHLHYLIIQLVELTDYYSNNLSVLVSLHTLLGHFSLDFVPKQILQPAFIQARTIIAASIQCISGFSEWENIFPLEDFNSFLEIINNDMKNKNIDVSAEHSLSYNDYLQPCAAALKFLYGIPKQVIKKDFILILYKKLRNIFTYDSAKLVQKFWSELSDNEKVEAILKLHKSLRFVQQYDAASIVINLFIEIYSPRNAKKLDKCKKELIYIAHYAFQNQRCVTEEQLTIFKALLYFADEMKKDIASSQFENDVLKYHPNVYSILFNRQKPEIQQKPQTSDDLFFDLLNPVQPIAPQNTNTKKYQFIKPPTDLSIPLNPADPFVKLQLKRLTRDFSIDELQKILINMIKSNDTQGIKLVLQYSFSKGIILDLTGLVFPEKSIPIVIQYLKSVKSPYLDKFISPYLENLNNLTIYLSIIKVNPTLYLQKISQSPKVKKVQMKNLAGIISVAGFPPNELIEAVTHCFLVAKSPQKLFYSLVLVQNTLHYLHEIPTEFALKIFNLFESRLSELNCFTATQILYILSVKMPTETKILDYVKQFKELVSPSSPELYYIYVMLENLTNGGSPIYSKEVPKTIDHLLESHFASVFITGMMLFTHAQKKLTGTRLQSLMKHGFNHILRRLTKTFKFYPIPETSTMSLINIINMPAFKKNQKDLIESLPKIISKPTDASFNTYYLLLIQGIGLVEEKKQYEDEQILFQNMAHDLLFTNISSSFLLRTYIKTVISRAEKMSSKPKQELFVMDNVTKFINIIQENADFYDMSSIILDWCSLLNMFNGFKQLLPIMSDHIFKNAQRFFPVFAGVAMFVKRFRNANQNNPEILNCLNSSFVGSGKQTMLIHRAHGMALQLLAVPGKMKIALDLASFDNDCPASDLIIQKLNSL